MGFRVVEGINPKHTTTTKIKTIDIVIEAQEENIIIIIKINKLSRLSIQIAAGKTANG